MESPLCRLPQALVPAKSPSGNASIAKIRTKALRLRYIGSKPGTPNRKPAP